MKGNPDVKRQFVRGAQNAAIAFSSTRRAKATIEDLPNQLIKLQNQLKEEENSKYPDPERIQRIKNKIATQEQLIERYCGPTKA